MNNTLAVFYLSPYYHEGGVQLIKSFLKTQIEPWVFKFDFSSGVESLDQLKKDLLFSNVAVVRITPTTEYKRHFEGVYLFQIQDPGNTKFLGIEPDHFQIVDLDPAVSKRLIEYAIGKPSEKPLLLIDFDGVIHNMPKGFNGDQSDISGPLILGVKESFKALREKYRIKIFTVRAGYESGKIAVENWLFNHGIEHDGVTAFKEFAVAYIDDNAIRFESWNQTLQTLRELNK